MRYNSVQSSIDLRDVRTSVKPKSNRKPKPLKRMPVVGAPADNIIQWAAQRQPLLLLEWMARGGQ